MRRYTQEELQRLKKTDNIASDGLYDEIVSFFHNDKDNVPMVIEGIGQTYPNPNYYMSRKRSETYTLEFVVKGKGHIIIDNVKYTVGPDDVYLLRVGTSHTYYANKNNPYQKIWINFNSDIFTTALKQMELENEVVFHAPECKEDFNILLSLGNLSTNNSSICYEVSSVVFKILFTIAQRNNEKIIKNDLPSRIRNELNKAIYHHTKIEEIADKVQISRQHLTREFKKAYNISPYQYLLEEKIKVSKKMLRYSNASIEAISEALGFINAAYFSYIFKKKTGISPLKYRKGQ